MYPDLKLCSVGQFRGSANNRTNDRSYAEWPSQLWLAYQLYILHTVIKDEDGNDAHAPLVTEWALNRYRNVCVRVLTFSPLWSAGTNTHYWHGGALLSATSVYI